MGQSLTTAGMSSNAPGTPGGSSAAAPFRHGRFGFASTTAGFEASWEVSSDATTAVQGEWVKGPSVLFDVMRSALGVDRLPFVAENLGVITPEVEALRERFELPGMAILQFAFGTDPQAPVFKPHNYPRNRVVYTGTHDNDTTVGWWTGEVGHKYAVEHRPRERTRVCSPLSRLDGREVHWEFIRAVLASVADTAIVPAQDLLGSEARMNRPGDGRRQLALAPARTVDG